MQTQTRPAPALNVAQWFNTEVPLSLQSLKGQVVVLYAFQMLCPACVSHGLPQMRKLHQAFADSGVAVLGLHTVFEHHAAMAPHALQAFLGEYRVGFPVGVDMASPDGPIPMTMQTYGLRGTPSLVVIDGHGQVRLQHFGIVDDLELGMLLGALTAEPAVIRTSRPLPGDTHEGFEGFNQSGRHQSGCAIRLDAATEN